MMHYHIRLTREITSETHSNSNTDSVNNESVNTESVNNVSTLNLF